MKSKSDSISILMIIRLSLGTLLFSLALLFQFTTWIEIGMYCLSYLLIGGEVVLKALKNIFRGKVFDENFLMSIATLGAFAIREFPEAVAVMLFYQIGELFQAAAVNKSRKSISALMDIRPDYANLKVGDEIIKMSPEEINIGDNIVIMPGERIPLDGIVIEGKSVLDTSALTGESMPWDVEVGTEVMSGSINKNGLLLLRVTKTYGESTVAKILNLVENASSNKAPTEKFITKFARYYTPVVVFAALGLAILPPLLIPGAYFSEWIHRALVFLVVSCPCALVISIPLGFFGGIGGASRNGILIKGSNYLEALNNVDTIIFDKTGTLTKGTFSVTKIRSIASVEADSILEYAAYAESYSTHPIAQSILKEYGKDIIRNEIQEYNEISGFGIKARIRGADVLVGNIGLLRDEGVRQDGGNLLEAEELGTVVYVAIDGGYIGHLVVSDSIKDDSKKAIDGLRDIGIRKIYMLTGDRKAVGESVGSQLGLDMVYSELLPHQKVEQLEVLSEQKKRKGKILFVGDGINDAPVLTSSDVGVAMGGLGSDAAMQAADIVIMTDEPSKLITAIKIAKKTRRIVWQNIIFALGVKALVLILGAGGIASMWEAVFADVGVALIAILNAMRVMKVDV